MGAGKEKKELIQKNTLRRKGSGVYLLPVMYSKDKFQTFTGRNMLRKIALELDNAQRHLAGEPLHPPYIKGCLERAASYLHFGREAGKFDQDAALWAEQLAELLQGAYLELPPRTLFARINHLFHAVSDKSAMPVGENHFKIRTNDRQTVEPDKFPCRLILDNLRSAFNAGTIFRSGDGFGVERIHLTGITPGGDNAKVRKTAMGADRFVEWQQDEDLETAVTSLQAEGYTVYALETVEGSGSLFDEELQFPLACIAGNEEFGVLENALDRVDRIIHIPMFGHKNSFNVGITCGIFLYEARRQWEARR